MNARGYGLTNLGLYLACAAAIAAFLTAAGASPRASSVAALAWAMNPHGINMGVVWLSGRTSLLLTLCAVLSALAFVRVQRVAGAMFLMGALLAKEEALLLPAVIGIVVFAVRQEKPDWRDAVALCAPLGVYAALRLQTPAFTPASAPWFYTPTTSASLLAVNAAAYLDRAGTIFLLAAIAACICYRTAPLGLWSTPTAVAGFVWFAGGLALTVWIPVRSSLYAVYPSVGGALVCASAIDAARRNSKDPLARDRVVVAVLAAALLFVPVYRQRNARWVEPARVSSRAVAAMRAFPPPDRPGTIVFEDESADYSSLANAFGDLASEAVRVATGRVFRAVVGPPGAVRDSAEVVARYRLTGGHIERVD